MHQLIALCCVFASTSLSFPVFLFSIPLSLDTSHLKNEFPFHILAPMQSKDSGWLMVLWSLENDPLALGTATAGPGQYRQQDATMKTNICWARQGRLHRGKLQEQNTRKRRNWYPKWPGKRHTVSRIYGWCGLTEWREDMMQTAVPATRGPLVVTTATWTTATQIGTVWQETGLYGEFGLHYFRVTLPESTRIFSTRVVQDSDRFRLEGIYWRQNLILSRNQCWRRRNDQ